jgi:hypothetical protein
MVVALKCSSNNYNNNKKVITVPGATHLFEESGALEEVARLASGWFRCYFLIKEHNNSNSTNNGSSTQMQQQ